MWQTVTFTDREAVTFEGSPVTFDGSPVYLYGDTETVTHDGETVYFCPDDDCPPSTAGGAAKFDRLSRGMLVVDQEAWEEEGVILPLTLDGFP